MTVSAGPIVEYRVEQYQRIRPATDTPVLTFFLKALYDSGSSGDMPTGRSTGSHYPFGIDAKISGVMSQPSDHGLGVLHAFPGGTAVPDRDTILRRYGHHAAAGKVFRLRVVLGRRTVIPAPPEEEHDRRTLAGGALRLGHEDMEIELGRTKLVAGHSLVGQNLVRLELWHIG